MNGISRRRAWAAVAVMFAAILLSYADQGLPLLLIDQIKAAFHVTDTQVAILTGFSFAVSVSVFALPLSWIADRFDRVWLIAAGVALWCLATVGCGFANGFWTLFVMRTGVGLGEAALRPTGYSLMADLFAAEDLPRPLAILALSAMLGGVVALNGVGLAFGALEHLIAARAIPLAHQDIWRAIMIAFGAVGLVVAVLAALVLPEPRRWSASPLRTEAPRPGVWRYMIASSFFYAPFILSMTAFVLYDRGFSNWLAPFFQRTYGWSVARTGQALGTVGLVCGLAGLPLGVWINAQLQRRLRRPAPAATIWLVLALVTPLAPLVALAPSGWTALALILVIQLPLSAATVVTPVVFTSTAPPRLRAQVVSVCGLVYGVGGAALGPVAFGAFTDLVVKDPAQLRITMSVLPLGLALLFTPLAFLADRRFEPARALAQRWALSEE